MQTLPKSPLIPFDITMKHHTILTIGLLCSLAFSGCSKNVSLQGKVTFEDGSPLTVGTVNFTSESGLSRGIIQPDGTYQIGTLKSGDGLLPGTYKVYITGAVEAAAAAATSTQTDSMGNPVESIGSVRQLIDLQFVTAEATPLVCEVPAPGNRFDITVTPFAAR